MTQYRMFIGTLNNPKCFTEEFIKSWVDKHGAIYATGQLEKGKEGTPHIQFFVQYKDQKRITNLKKYCREAHFEGVKVNNGADDYCMKEDTRLEGPFEAGVRPARRNKKGDVARRNAQLIEMGAVEAVDKGLIPVEKFKQIAQALEMYRGHKAMPKARDELVDEWHYGPTGTGKTRGVTERYPDAYRKTATKWWDHYQHEPVVFIDEMAPDRVDGHHMKLWCDHYPFRAETKGGCIIARPARIIVCSNYTIRQCYPKPEDYEPLERRFTVHRYHSKL